MLKVRKRAVAANMEQVAARVQTGLKAPAKVVSHVLIWDFPPTSCSCLSKHQVLQFSLWTSTLIPLNNGSG